MALFGKLVAADQGEKRSKPLQLPPINNAQVFDERMLVGRVLNPEIQESLVKALVAFLSSMWKCEGRVHGIEMERGRFHFRCEEECVLQSVLDNRPYPFDG
ncbi:unnamed protein product [Arabis nemorensis]|uniref:DUF4283 domain-containing protein n=1 Tax=Arabis nemorensis TaxID=586526 RepID=A0A565AN39_9BRAS|nr:unnamed protein product [Arabis nemorensis]